MPQRGKPGQLAHGYDIQVEHVGSAMQHEAHQLWCTSNSEAQEVTQQFVQENVGNPDVHAVRVYRSSERQKWADKRNIIDEYDFRDPSIPYWHEE